MTQRTIIKQKPDQEILPDIEPNKCRMTARDFLKSEPDIRDFINNPNLKLDMFALSRPNRPKRAKSNMKLVGMSNVSSAKRLKLPPSTKHSTSKEDSSLKTQVKIYKKEKVAYKGSSTHRRSTLAVNIV